VLSNSCYCSYITYLGGIVVFKHSLLEEVLVLFVGPIPVPKNCLEKSGILFYLGSGKPNLLVGEI